MHWSSTIVALFLIPVVVGQDLSVEDAAGDVQFETFIFVGDDLYTPAPSGYEHIDILSVAIGKETETTFDVEVTFAGQPNLQSPISLGNSQLHFGFNGANYRVAFGLCDGTASLAVLNTGSGRFDALSCLEGAMEGTTAWATVPKELVRSVAGVPAAFGSTLTDLRAELRELVAVTPLGIGTTYAVDFAPDVGSFSSTFSFALGEGGLGDLRIATPDSIRASNGGPDTFVYGIYIQNDGEDTRLAVTTSDVPAQWDVRAAPIVLVPAGAQIVVPVAVATRVAHGHGGTDTFAVDLSFADEPGTSIAVELGIHYLDVPQLAGHHPELFIHGATETFDVGGVQPTDVVVAWMNTLREAPGAEDVTIPAAGGGTGVNEAGTTSSSSWSIPMDPKLLIGMDFDLDRTGELVASFVAENRLPGDVTLAAVLWHCNPQNATGSSGAPNLPCPGGDWHRLANGIAEPVAMPTSGQFNVEVEMSGSQYADLVPYVAGSNVALQLVMGRDAAPANGYPRLQPEETSVRLPLNDYRDPIEDAFSQIGTLAVEPLSPFSKQANAGQTVWFEFELQNDGGSREVETVVFGHNDAWVTIIAAPAKMASGDAAVVAIRVDVPKDALPGDFAEAFVLVQDVDDATQAAISKFRVSVTESQVQQEAPLAIADNGGKDSPGLGVVVLLACLAWAARRR